jgi:hypothetical protein
MTRSGSLAPRVADCPQVAVVHGPVDLDRELGHAPTRPYEEEAEAAAERMKADAKAQAEAAEAQAEAEAAAQEKPLSPREARKYILPPVRFDKPPFDGVDVTEQVVKSRAEIRKRCPDFKFEPGFDLACSRILRLYAATGEVTKVFCTIHIVNDKVIRAAGYEPDNVRRHEIGHCNGWPAEHRGARAPRKSACSSPLPPETRTAL